MGFHLMFLYGTLKTSQPNHHLMENPKNGSANFVGQGYTEQKFPLVIASEYNIPCVMYKEGTGKEIQGELWEVDDAMLAVLDDLEGHPGFYEREITQAVLTEDSNGRTQCLQKECWLYFLKRYKTELLRLPFLDNYDNKENNRIYKETYRRDIEVVRKAMMTENVIINKLIN